MESNEEKEIYIPEVGRGCGFCDDGYEVKAVMKEGCFKLHEAQWTEGYPDNTECDIFEVRFKNTRRGFYRNVNGLELRRGDIVAVEASPGHDIGVISMTGDLVARQMRRVGFVPQGGEFRKIYRKAKPYDIERWQEAIALEHETMIASRQIAADMGLNMKIGDVEYQGDKIKAIFYYIADERVDFRELIKVFAERFHIRIEMKQIGARQEAGRIGGLGVCGRELCCASWIANFTSVTTGAARTQELSLNPQKMAGQCSKLKCCLMYEYDTYADARRIFPRVKEPLQALDGDYFLIKSDILAGTMTFSSSKESLSNLVTLPVGRVREIQEMNFAGEKVEQLSETDTAEEFLEEPTYRSEEDSITRFDSKRRKRSGKKRKDQSRNAKEGARGAKEGAQGETAKGVTPKEGAAKEGSKERGRERSKDLRENREPKELKEPREPRELRESKESPETRESAQQQPKSRPARQRQGNNRGENRGENSGENRNESPGENRGENRNENRGENLSAEQREQQPRPNGNNRRRFNNRPGFRRNNNRGNGGENGGNGGNSGGDHGAPKE